MPFSCWKTFSDSPLTKVLRGSVNDLGPQRGYSSLPHGEQREPVCTQSHCGCRHRTWAKERCISVYDTCKRGSTLMPWPHVRCATGPCTETGQRRRQVCRAEDETQNRRRVTCRHLCSWGGQCGAASLEVASCQLPGDKASWLCSQKTSFRLTFNSLSSKLLHL